MAQPTCKSSCCKELAVVLRCMELKRAKGVQAAWRVHVLGFDGPQARLFNGAATAAHMKWRCKGPPGLQVSYLARAAEAWICRDHICGCGSEWKIFDHRRENWRTQGSATVLLL